MKREAVAVYDLSGKAGWAVFTPGLPAPEHGILRLPPTLEDGSMGPGFQLLFDHIAWIDRKWPLMALGYEQFIAPTGSKKDEDKDFVTSPATLKRQIGTIAIAEMCAAMIGIPVHSINNASWRRYWLGSQRRGTDRKTWKMLSVSKATALGWTPRGDDDADAIGQLHFLLAKLEIKPAWGPAKTPQDLAMLGLKHGVPVHV